MNRIQLLTRSLVLLASIIALASAAQAQATRTWVSGIGDDVNPCSRTAPCKTFAGAISKTATNGYISVLDPGGFGHVTITKSITIEGNPGGITGLLPPPNNGIDIAFDSFQASDTRKAVFLRNLTIEGGASPGVTPSPRGVHIKGGAFIGGGNVTIDNCVFDGQGGNPGRGVTDHRSAGGRLVITNSTFQNLAGTAIGHDPDTGGARLDVVIDNVKISNALYGVAMSSGSRVIVSNSLITGCTNAGIFSEGLVGTASEMNIENVILNNNNIGVQNNGGAVGTTIRISNSTITSNGTGISGATLSYLNNKVAGNTNAGTFPTNISQQ